MFDQAMVWNTDAHLQVTSLTARLRDFAGIGHDPDAIHVGALWDDRDPFPLLAHRWCLKGEAVNFEATAGRRNGVLAASGGNRRVQMLHARATSCA